MDRSQWPPPPGPRAAGSQERVSMRAAVVQRYGGPEVLAVAQVPRPACGADEVLIRVAASAVCRGDAHLLTGTPYLLRLAGYGVTSPRYRIPGQNVSGRILAVGAGVRDLVAGEEVYGEVPRGALAEIVAAPARLIARKPKTLSHDQAAAVPISGVTALQSLRDAAALRAGQSVLVNGASGGVGTLAVQIAKSMGAEVTAVCSSRHGGLMRTLGADQVIDYALEDFASGGRRFDVVLDVAGSRTVADAARVLKERGVLVAVGELDGGRWLGPAGRMLRVAAGNPLSRRTLRPFMAKPGRDDLAVLAGLIDDGRLRPVIDRVYTLDGISEAYAHVLSGPVQGTTVVRILAD